MRGLVSENQTLDVRRHSWKALLSSVDVLARSSCCMSRGPC